MRADNLINEIQQRGVLNAGVSLGFSGFSRKDEEKDCWTGFDVDIARAVAAGVLGDSSRIHYVPLQSGDRFTALGEGLIDLGCYNASITFSREVLCSVRFIQPILFDGEALLTRRENLREGATSLTLASLKNRTIAVMRGSTTRANLLRYFEEQDLSGEIVLFDSPAEARQAYEQGLCTAYCLDYYLLAAEQSLLAKPDTHLILDDVISREAMSPAVSNKDVQWGMAVSWIIRALIEAEELGIRSDNIDSASASKDAYIRTFLFPDQRLCELLGLPLNFTRTVIAQVGNYEEIFARNLGMKSVLKLDRKENRLRSKGGLLYSPLFI